MITSPRASRASRRTGRTRAAVAVLAVPAFLLTACGGGESGGDESGGGEPAAEGGTLTIATGGTGGVYYPLGGGMANVITQNVEGWTATAQETNASVDNMLLVQNESADMALGLGDAVADAVEGVGSFEGNAVDICSMGHIYNNVMQAVTTQGTDIASIPDMAGKVVSVGAPGSATEVSAKRILEAAGLDPETDLEIRQLGVAETVAALRDATIDAGFWSGGLPTGALVDLASTGEMELVPSGEYAEDLAAEYGDYYAEAEIPAETYSGQTEAVSVVGSPNILVALKSMDEQLQEDLVTALFEHKEELVQVHPAAKEMDPAMAADVPFIDTCPGAQAYYDSVN